MNRLTFIKNILTAVFMLSITLSGVFIFDKDTEFVNQFEPQQDNSPQEDVFYFSNFEATAIFSGITRLNLRISNSNQVVRLTNSSTNFLRNHCLTQLTQQIFNITQNSFTFFYSEKEKQGYYIYTLCKLLI